MKAARLLVAQVEFVLNVRLENRVAAAVADSVIPEASPHLLWADARQIPEIKLGADACSDGGHYGRHDMLPGLECVANATSPGSRRRGGVNPEGRGEATTYYAVQTLT